MDPALERFTAHLIDYAGTFPPASLAPEAALAEWRGHVEGPDARLIRALSWTATDVARLTGWTGPAIDVTAIASAGDDWDAAREADAAALTAFAKTLPEAVSLAAYECALPGDRPLAAALDSLSGFGGVALYVETADPEALAEIAEREWASAKFRVGASDPATLAAFLYNCVSLDLEFKLTGGLHAPYSDGQSVGFLNALSATTLALVDDLGPDELEAILREKGPTWRPIEREEAEEARELFEAIGSCSVRDIVEGLARCS